VLSRVICISEHVIEPAKKAVDAPLKPVTLHKAHFSQMSYERAVQTCHC